MGNELRVYRTQCGVSTLKGWQYKATGEDTRTPYQRFEDLAKRVFAVPKTKLDKRLAEYERQKANRRKKRKP